MSKKLLLADDSITIQKVIQITFAHEDYELSITDNGDAALAKAQEIKPDLVMADVYMPGKNGYELTTAIKQDPNLQNVPVLLLAGSFEPFDEDKARSCQANAWIEKPFESQNLIDKVAELLSAAPQAVEAAPVAEPVPVVEEAPVEAPVEESPLASFDEPAAVEPVAAEPAPADDPFGDVSFEEEAPAVEPEPAVEPFAAADDWSDVAAEPAEELPVAEETFAAPQEEPVVAFEEPVADDVFAAADAVPVAEAEVDSFDMGDEEIMALDDDDILGAEDLEPAPDEPTLASWSRGDAENEDIFGEPIEELPAVEEDVFTDVPAVEEVSAFADEPVAEESAFEVSAEPEPVFEAPVEPEPVFETTPEPEPAFAAPAPEPESVFTEEPVAAPVAAVAATEVEAKTASMSEGEIEQIIEKVVEKVVERLAGSILEKVAWEVVPDMAESIIKEEIRKIKDAAA